MSDTDVVKRAESDMGWNHARKMWLRFYTAALAAGVTETAAARADKGLEEYLVRFHQPADNPDDFVEREPIWPT